MDASNGLRTYKLTGPWPMNVLAPAKCCLFCDHCTDIFYDWGGIYALVCDIGADTDKGSVGECNQFEEE